MSSPRRRRPPRPQLTTIRADPFTEESVEDSNEGQRSSESREDDAAPACDVSGAAPAQDATDGGVGSSSLRFGVGWGSLLRAGSRRASDMRDTTPRHSAQGFGDAVVAVPLESVPRYEPARMLGEGERARPTAPSGCR